MTETPVQKKAVAPTARTAKAARAAAQARQAAPRPTGPSPERTLVVVKVHSGIGCTQRQRGVLRSLGLKGPRDRRALPDVPAVRGMVAALPHLVRIEETPGKGGASA